MKRLGGLLVVLIGLSALSGCVDNRDEYIDDPATEPENRELLQDAIPYTWEDCVSVQAFVWFDIDRARAFLPAGYEPTDDGGNLAGLNPGLGLTGLANLGIIGSDCSNLDAADGPTSWAYVYIDIEPPHVANRTSPSGHNAYDVIHYVSSGDHESVLLWAGIPTARADVSVQLSDLALEGLQTGQIVISGDAGAIMTIAVVAAGDTSVSPTIASWYQHADGVTLTSIDGSASYYFGTTVECQVAAGSLIAELIGATDCSTTHSPTGYLAKHFSVAGTIEVIHGAKAEVGV